MKKFLFCCLVACTAAFAQRAETYTFLASLSPANEVPAIPTLNANGTGIVYAHVVRDANNVVVSGSLDFVLLYSFSGAVQLTGMHIHAGAAGVNGPVVIDSGVTGASPVPVADPFRGSLQRQGQVGTTAQLDALRGMLTNPGNYYFNVHTTDNPGGAIRGQVMWADRSVLLGRMSTKKEIPAIDLNALGTVSIEALRAQVNGRTMAGVVVFDVDYQFPEAVTFTGLHIHRGAADVNGPVVINTGIGGGATSVQTPPNGTGNLLYRVEVAPTTAAAAALDGLFDEPEQYYANLHTTVNAGGVIRANLSRSEMVAIPTILSPANEVPPITGLNASAPSTFMANILRDNTGAAVAAQVAFDVNYRFPGEVTITGLHIHNGKVGENGPVTINSRIGGGATSVVSTTGNGNIWRTVNVGGGDALSALNSLLANPENHYLNLHTTINAGGAIRGQMGVANTNAPRLTEAIGAVSDLRVRTVAPGGLFTVFGENFAKVPASLNGLEMPQVPSSVNGVTVTIGGQSAPILNIGTGETASSPQYILAQVPANTASGEMDVEVRNAAGASNRRKLTVAPVAPAVYFDGVGTIAYRMSDISIVRPDNPALRGERVAVLTTGLGEMNPASGTGMIPQTAGAVRAAISAMVGGQAATVDGAFAVPGYLGFQFVVLTVPQNAAAGNAEVLVRSGSITSNSTRMMVR